MMTTSTTTTAIVLLAIKEFFTIHSIQHLVVSTITIFLTTLEDSIWLLSFCVNASTTHIGIIHCIIYIVSFTILSTLICLVTTIIKIIPIILAQRQQQVQQQQQGSLVIDDTYNNSTTIFDINVTTINNNSSDIVILNSNNNNNYDQQEQYSLLCSIIGAILCWLLFIFFYCKAQQKRKRKIRQQQQQQQQQDNNPNKNSSSNNNETTDLLLIAESMSTKVLTTINFTDTNLTTTVNYGSTSTVVVPSFWDNNKNDNNDIIPDLNHKEHDNHINNNDISTGSLPLSSTNTDNSNSIQYWTIITLTIIGSIDEISYFPSMILTKTVSAIELIISTCIASILILFIVYCFLIPFQPLLYILDKIPNYYIILLFAILLSIEVVWDIIF